MTINGRTRHIIGYLRGFPLHARAGGAARWRGSPAASGTGCCWPGCSPSRPTCWSWTSRPTTWTWRRSNCWKTCLIEYPGTLLLVSHDREFLNNVVTSTLVLEGEGRVKEYAGGYDDWLRQRPAEPPPRPSPRRRKAAADAAAPRQRPRRLTYKEQRELEALPERIEALEAELGELHQATADPAFYRQAPAEIISVKARRSRSRTILPRRTAGGRNSDHRPAGD